MIRDMFREEEKGGMGVRQVHMYLYELQKEEDQGAFQRYGR